MSIKIDGSASSVAAGRDPPREAAMNFRISGLLAIAAFALTGFLGAQSLAQNAYITNFSDSTVLVINTQTDLVTATISQSFASPRAVSVTLDGSKVYITNTGNGTVSVIDTATNTVTATIPLPQGSLFGWTQALRLRTNPALLWQSSIRTRTP
jgi:YVTN family beta-propeller protein